jgi:hypothetical protein
MERSHPRDSHSLPQIAAACSDDGPVSHERVVLGVEDPLLFERNLLPAGSDLRDSQLAVKIEAHRPARRRAEPDDRLAAHLRGCRIERRVDLVGVDRRKRLHGHTQRDCHRLQHRTTSMGRVQSSGSGRFRRCDRRYKSGYESAAIQQRPRRVGTGTSSKVSGTREDGPIGHRPYPPSTVPRV